jgi:Methyl-accepting chemotaxis protein
MQVPNNMSDNLFRIVTAARENPDNPVTEFQHLSHCNIKLTSGSKEQTRSLNEIIQSIERINFTARQNAKNLFQANKLVSIAAKAVRESCGLMDEITRKIEEIMFFSKKIDDIFTVIDSIVFQINILALNAAVEAARAGVHGHRFAAIAAEVSTLSQRTSSAVIKNKILIEDFTSKIKEEAILLSHAVSAIRETRCIIHNVSNELNYIASSNSQLISEAPEYLRTVTKAESLTLKNATLTQDLTFSSQYLHEQTNRISKSIKIFKMTAD